MNVKSDTYYITCMVSILCDILFVKISNYDMIVIPLFMIFNNVSETRKSAASSGLIEQQCFATYSSAMLVFNYIDMSRFRMCIIAFFPSDH